MLLVGMYHPQGMTRAWEMSALMHAIDMKNKETIFNVRVQDLKSKRLIRHVTGPRQQPEGLGVTWA
jgi:hypothetical protein